MGYDKAHFYARIMAEMDQIEPYKRKSAKIKQELFCREWVIDQNGTRAAIAAGYSRHSAAPQASDLLNRPHIQKRINQLMEKRLSRLDLKADHVIDELAALAFSNMKDYVKIQDDGSAYVDLSNLTDCQMAAIQQIETEEWTEGRGERKRNVRKVKFKLGDKLGALEILARHLKVIGETSQTTNINVNLTEAERQKANSVIEHLRVIDVDSVPQLETVDARETNGAREEMGGDRE